MSRNIPTSTYRFQLTPPDPEKGIKGFAFADAQAQLPYVEKLGADTLYLSPINEATNGSTHGYDGTDFGAVRQAFGGKDGFRRFADAAHAKGLKVIVDFVPNHLGIETGRNEWWNDVLTNGAEAAHAGHFDIDWKDGGGKVTLPFHGHTGGELINEGFLKLAKNGNMFEFVAYPEGDNPKHYPLSKQGLEIIAESAMTADEINDDKTLLGKIYETQNYRLEPWTTDDLTHRRFFTISSLAGVRVEEPAVFDDVHRELASWVKEGLIDGIRLDHVDGLSDPGKYLKDLRKLVGPDVYIVAEKILGPEESLPESWNNHLQGTTGYDGLIAVNRVLTHPSEELADTYRRYLGEEKLPDYAQLRFKARRDMIDSEFGPEVNRLGRMLAERVRENFDLELDAETSRNAVKLLAASFPVYRTYITDKTVSLDDRITLETAREEALRFAPSEKDAQAVHALHYFLSNPSDDPKDQEFIRRFQQFTGPVVAKGNEDTLFFRHHILRAAAEVGAELDRLGMTPEDFTDFLQHRSATTMNALSSHDTKLGEDTRARGIALSHRPEEWAEKALSWKERCRKFAEETAVNGQKISLNDQYLALQSVVSTIPLKLLFDHAENRNDWDEYGNRVKAFMEKAAREAKENTSWVDIQRGDITPKNENYEKACKNFIDRLLNDEAFRHDELLPFTREIAKTGTEVSMAQRVLQMAMPGVPDVYQGSEGEHFSFGDPDCRRPVDYEKLNDDIGRNREDGESFAQKKQKLTHQLLKARKGEFADVFASNEGGELQQVHIKDADGQETKDAYGFVRTHGDQSVLVVVPTAFGAGHEANGPLRIELPDELEAGKFTHALIDGPKTRLQGNKILLEGSLREGGGVVLGSER